MNKRLLILVVVAISAIAVYTLLHKEFKKSDYDQANIQNTDTNAHEPSAAKFDINVEQSIAYKDIVNFLKENEGKHLLFLSDQSQDTQYIEASILMPLLGEFETPLNMAITNVDMKDTSNVSVVNLKKALNIDKFPAFVLIESNPQDKSYEVISSITFTSDSPFTSEELKTWFFNNGLWTGPYGKN